MTVVYEWTLEEIDVDGDIIDSDFSDKIPTKKDCTGKTLGLLRNEGSEDDGNSSGATSNGDNSKAKAVKGGVATAIGKNAMAAGSVGAWLSITEGEYDDKGEFYIKDLKAAIVDGKKIKADTWYKLVNSKIVEA